MQSTPEVTSGIDFELPTLKPKFTHRQSSIAPVALSGRRVLLIGHKESWGMSLLKSFENFGCEFSFASPGSVTSEAVRNGGYFLLLVDSTVPPVRRRQITSRLLQSEASVFYCYPVEYGCWWIPALLFGDDRLGAPAFRTRDFVKEIERLLQVAGTIQCSRQLSAAK
jgi:hypothetical protein